MSRFGIKENVRELLVRTRGTYEKLPGGESMSWKHHRKNWANRMQRPRMSITRIITFVVVAVVLTVMLATGIYKKRVHRGQVAEADTKKQYHWQHYDP